jgi:hypothetical protein
MRDLTKAELLFRCDNDFSIVFKKVMSVKQVQYFNFELKKQYEVKINNLKNQRTGSYYLGIEVKPVVDNSAKIDALLEIINKEPTTDVEVDNLCKQLEGNK